MSKIVKLTNPDIKKAEAFALARWDCHDGLYSRRGGFKMIDILIGACAEIAVYKMLKPYFKIGKPDFTIHDRKKKSYNADLTDGTFHFHVKGQGLDSAYRYGCSWIMQRHDPLLSQVPMNNFIVPCLVDIKEKKVEVFGIFSIALMVERQCIGECKVPHMRNNKVAIYKDHLDSLMTKASRWSILRKSDK
jgi:hypothetical protein